MKDFDLKRVAIIAAVFGLDGDGCDVTVRACILAKIAQNDEAFEMLREAHNLIHEAAKSLRRGLKKDGSRLKFDNPGDLIAARNALMDEMARVSEEMTSHE